MQKITPFLWYDDKAEEAANFYVRFSRIPGLVTLPVMTKRGQRRPEDQKDR